MLTHKDYPMPLNLSQYLGETTDYDKKAAVETRKPRSWLKSVSAFANGTGGTILFGITDDDQICGIDDVKKASEDISELMKMRMEPVPECNLSIHSVEVAGSEKHIIILKVFAGKESPYYYFGDGTRTAFVRVGNESIPADAVTLKHLILSSNQQSWDSLKTSYESKRFTFGRLFSGFLRRMNRNLKDEDLVSFGLVDENGLLTNAGALFVDDCPIRHSRLFCTRWNGKTKASGKMKALDDLEISGSLVTLLLDGLGFISRNNRKRWTKTPDTRIEMPDYPERAAQECLVNALAHRDYLEFGSEVHIDIFDDRMEFYSPGGMFSGWKVQDLNLDRVPSIRRNPIVADVLGRMNFMERRGSGFKQIREDYELAANWRAGLEPVFYSDQIGFWVTLYNLNYGCDVELETTQAHNGTTQAQNVRKDDVNNRNIDTETNTENVLTDTKNVLTDTETDTENVLTGTEKLILNLIRNNPSSTLDELARDAMLSKSGVRYILRKLRVKGNVIREGAQKNGKWIIIRE